MFRGFGSRKLQTAANAGLSGRGSAPDPVLSNSNLSAPASPVAAAPAATAAPAAPAAPAAAAAPAGPRRTFKNRIFGNATQQANAGFLAAAKSGNVAKLNTYIGDETAKGLISDDTKQKALLLSANIVSLECFTAIANAFPESLNAKPANQNVLHVIFISLNKASSLNITKKTKIVENIKAILSLINQKNPTLVDNTNDKEETPLDILSSSSTKDTDDVLSYLLGLPIKPTQATLDKALAKIFNMNVKVKNVNGWNKLFPKGQVHYKKVSALLAAGAKPPKNAPGVYGPLMGYYTTINKNINRQKAKIMNEAEQKKRTAEAEASAAATEEQAAAEAEQAAASAAAEAATKAKAAANALAAKRKARAAAITKKTNVISKVNSSKTAAVAALAPRKRFLGLFGGKRTRKNRKH